MKNCTLIYYITFLSGLIYSCSLPSTDWKVLMQAEQVMQSNPDSALALLKSITNTENLNKESFAIYQLLYTQAKDKCYIDISKDTVILKVAEYFQKKGNDKRAGWAYYYAGRVYYDATYYKESSLYFLKAKEYSIKTSDFLLGTLANFYFGEFHSEQFAYNDALKAYKEAYRNCEKTEERRYETFLLNCIGYTYAAKEQLDSALFYIGKAHSIAVLNKDTSEIVSITNDFGVFLYENKQYDEAKQYIIQSILLQQDKEISPAKFISLADIYCNLNNPDSAMFYLNVIDSLIKNSTDIGLKAIYCLSRGKIAEIKHNYQEALIYYKQYIPYSDTIYQKKQKNSFAKVEQIYNYAETKKKNSELINQRRGILLFIILLIGCLITLYYFFRSKIKRKEQNLINAEETMEMLQQFLKESKEKQEMRSVSTLESNEEKEVIFKNLLLQQLNIVKKVALMHAQSFDKNESFLTKFNDVIYGEQRSFNLNWNELYPLLNTLYNNYVIKLRKLYPVLSEKDIQLCCLLKVDLKTAEIAFLMNQSVNTVHKRKTDIRKKIAIPEAGDIVVFLNEKLL